MGSVGGGLSNPLYCTENNCLFYAACTADWESCAAKDIMDDVDAAAKDLEEVDETTCDVKAVTDCIVEAATIFNNKFGDSKKNPGCAEVVNMYRGAFGMIPY